MSGGFPDNIHGFSWKGKTLLSGVDPFGKAERTAESVAVMDRTLYLCPSPLYGYGLELLLERIAVFPNSALLCVEAEPELFAISREHFNTALKNNQRLRLTNRCEPGTLCALLRQEWGPRFFRRVEVIRFTGGWQLHRELYDMLVESLRREIALDWGNAMTLTRLGRRYIRNALRNLTLFPHCGSLQQLDFGSDPALVLGAGPSLDHLLDGLQARFGGPLQMPEKRSFRIICVDTCLAALRERGITPDLAVILESQHWNLEDFTGLSGWKVPAALDLSALPRSASVLDGGLFLFFTPWTTLKIFGRLEAAGLLPLCLPPLGSVGLSAAAISCRLTRGTIIAAGLDFAFTLDSYHARSTPGHKKRLRRQNRFTGILNVDAAFGGAVFGAVSKTGGHVFSTPALRNYRDLFEREFGGVANNGARFFDVDGNGLPLGVKTLSPEEAFDLLFEGHGGGNVSHGGTGGTSNLRFADTEDIEKRNLTTNPNNKPHGVAVFPHLSQHVVGLIKSTVCDQGGLASTSPAADEPTRTTDRNQSARTSPEVPSCGSRGSWLMNLESFIQDERKRLVLLRDMLTGTAAMDSDALVTLIDECDYLWAHFPDYAAADRRPGKAELADGTALSFLKRLRVEIDPFLKLWDLSMSSSQAK